MQIVNSPFFLSVSICFPLLLFPNTELVCFSRQISTVSLIHSSLSTCWSATTNLTPLARGPTCIVSNASLRSVRMCVICQGRLGEYIDPFVGTIRAVMSAYGKVPCCWRWRAHVPSSSRTARLPAANALLTCRPDPASPAFALQLAICSARGSILTKSVIKFHHRLQLMLRMFSSHSLL
ncbi:hypothetical protein B0H65DRAFT_46864 [Neurospora tetraspora]|uniref:Secreted protein n=1 Tax=Neurospora tetraspora TaxID=94610 RepID=A0AAE0JPN9_9PEZI|nr:hypothetical protein B0H65DRAFT_46864 [Neurospora tetraspora]